MKNRQLNIWQSAGIVRNKLSFYCDINGQRCYVRPTVRSGNISIGEEYQASIGGIRIGEFKSLMEAQLMTEKKAAQRPLCLN